MTHNYQFASIADNTHGPIPTNIEISEQVFNNYYVLIRHLKPLTNLYKVFNMVKTELGLWLNYLKDFMIIKYHLILC